MPSKQTANVGHSSSQNTTATQIDISRLNVSVSELLGYDYVFVSGEYATRCFGQQTSAIDATAQLIARLHLKPEQAVFISVDEAHTSITTFTRHDISWVERQVRCLQNTLISNPEQHEFINMIWQCSCEYVG